MRHEKSVLNMYRMRMKTQKVNQGLDGKAAKWAAIKIYRPEIPKNFQSPQRTKRAAREAKDGEYEHDVYDIKDHQWQTRPKMAVSLPENPNKVPEPQLKQPPFRQVRSSQGDRRTWGRGGRGPGASEGLSLNLNNPYSSKCDQPKGNQRTWGIG
ncbi:hypothetical protein CEXT_488581 [Caerostris extrusa]|uniref:Uncharacterized protein n=1 Tax=Caerostris extrusa TaxID=172846 RepID=A0AAV4PMG1_CAEEX|nr:hypothetical protein CEXT_488581 [Caerostris extrusa]